MAALPAYDRPSAFSSSSILREPLASGRGAGLDLRNWPRAAASETIRVDDDEVDDLRRQLVLGGAGILTLPERTLTRCIRRRGGGVLLLLDRRLHARSSSPRSLARSSGTKMSATTRALDAQRNLTLPDGSSRALALATATPARCSPPSLA